jgi:hypothetical protein
MTSTASTYTVFCVCRNCGQPMDVLPQKTISGGWTQMLTCPNTPTICFMGKHTLDARDYPTLDLAPYKRSA